MLLAKKIGENLMAQKHLQAFGYSILLAVGLAIFPADLAIAQSASGKVELKATLDRRAIEPTESVVLSVSVESTDEVEPQSPTLPPMNDFEVLNQWQAKEVRANLVQTPTGPQFQTMRRMVFNYQLSPKRLGALTIYPVEVVIDGRSYRTSALTLQVASGAGRRQAPNAAPGARPPPGFEDEEASEEEDLFSQLLRRGMGQIPRGGGSRTLPTNPKDAFFIQVETDKTEAYVGEQVTVSFFLYTTGLIRDLDTLKYPSLKGFWKEDIEIATHLNFQQEVVDGVPYKKALLASFALFPIKEGTAMVDSYQAKCTVIPGADPFGALGMGRAFTFTKASQPVKITVKPTPLEGRPADFSGAVGDFAVTARIEDNNVVANQPFPLKIRFEGRGNAKLVDIPPFQPPEGMELYDTQKEAKFFGWGTSFKEFTVQLIPRRDGEFEIPPIAASMFDPVTKKYISRATEPLRVRVGRGTGATRGGSESFTGGKGEDRKSEKAKGPIEPRLVEQFKSSSKWTTAQAVGGAAGIYSLVIALLFAIAAKELGWGRGKPKLNRLVKARVRGLQEKASSGDLRQFGVSGVNLLAFTLREIVGDRLSEREVLKLLSATPPSIQKECGKSVEELLAAFETLAFAPEATLGDWKDLAKVKSLISKTSEVLLRMVSLSGSDEQGV
jgi:hypothetical protein